MPGIQAGMYHSLWGEMQRESGSQSPTHTKAIWTKLEFFSFFGIRCDIVTVRLLLGSEIT